MKVILGCLINCCAICLLTMSRHLENNEKSLNVFAECAGIYHQWEEACNSFAGVNA
jgi:hypothetical protein